MEPTLYPLKFRQIIKEMIWGSESWEITCRSLEMGIIENGELAGVSFSEFISKNPVAVLGLDFFDGRPFPLLVKIIDARDALSVQVHPNDEYARLKGESDSGKSELWYILTPPTDGELIVGLNRGVTREDLAKAYKNGTVEDCLSRIKVRRGDIINIPAGLVHALTPGTVVAEIQQNSDITYRLYDFGRDGADGKPRPLHVSDALACATYDTDDTQSLPSVRLEAGDSIRGGHFSVQKLVLSAPLALQSNPEKFSIFICTYGCVFFETANHAVRLPAPRSVFIPAMLGEYIIRPEGESAILIKCEP